MRNKWFSYIYIDERKSAVLTSGITFEEFYAGIADKPANLLIVGEESWARTRDDRLGLDYIPQDRMRDFSTSDVSYYGDFCWVDFPGIDRLALVTDRELSELLFDGGADSKNRAS